MVFNRVAHLLLKLLARQEMSNIVTIYCSLIPYCNLVRNSAEGWREKERERERERDPDNMFY